MMSRSHRWRSQTAQLIFLLAALGGCARMERDAQAVFLMENRVSAALIEATLAAELRDPGLADRLYQGERELRDACAPLNGIAYHGLLGETAGIAARIAALDALEACERASAEAARLIWRTDPQTARAFLDDLPGTPVAGRPPNRPARASSSADARVSR